MQLALEILGKKVTVRDRPHVFGKVLGSIEPYSTVEYMYIVDDAMVSSWKWFALPGGGFCNYIYPPAGVRFTLNPRYGIVLHDHEMLGISRPERNGAPTRVYGLPETQKLMDNSPVILTEDLQWFWYDKLKLSYPSTQYDEDLPYKKYMQNAFKSLTHGGRAVTNFKGWNNGYANYPSEINLDKGPMAFEPILMGGALVQILGQFFKYGEWFYKIRAIDAKKPLPDIDQYTTPYLFYYATVSTRNALGPGIRQVDPFPQLSGRDVPIPIFSNTGANAIRQAVVRLLEPDEEAPSPYVR